MISASTTNRDRIRWSADIRLDLLETATVRFSSTSSDETLPRASFLVIVQNAEGPSLTQAWRAEPHAPWGRQSLSCGAMRRLRPPGSP